MSLSVLDVLFVVWPGDGKHESGKQTKRVEEQKESPSPTGFLMPSLSILLMPSLSGFPDHSSCSFENDSVFVSFSCVCACQL